MESILITAAVFWAVYFLVQRFRPKKDVSGCGVSKDCGCH
ncbi:MAG: FeoB-associated Cys-rich membrane protein [Flavobacteriaceae bacterium]|nr:FeoB-associated Cys-rich membrane protein [Flavobacteriaceae bacterium]